MSQVAKSIFVFFARAAVIALIGFLLYQRGYNEAVESARLIYADDTSYMIASTAKSTSTTTNEVRP